MAITFYVQIFMSLSVIIFFSVAHTCLELHFWESMIFCHYYTMSKLVFLFIYYSYCITIVIFNFTITKRKIFRLFLILLYQTHNIYIYFKFNVIKNDLLPSH